MLNNKNISTIFWKAKLGLLSSILCLVSGCIDNNNPTVEPFQPSSALTYKKPLALKTNSSALVQAIVSKPAVSRALTSAAVAKERVAISQTQKEITVSASGSSGFETDTDDGSEGVLIVGVTAQKTSE